MTAYTFDADIITDALIGKKKSDPKVVIELFVDKNQALKGSTRKMPDRLQSLVDAGVVVRLIDCKGFSAQHSKMVLIDQVILIVGSTNWTHNSTKNVEFSQITRLNSMGAVYAIGKLRLIARGSLPYDDKAHKEAVDSRAQSTSLPEDDDGKLAIPQRITQFAAPAQALKDVMHGY